MLLEVKSEKSSMVVLKDVKEADSLILLASLGPTDATCNSSGQIDHCPCASLSHMLIMSTK